MGVLDIMKFRKAFVSLLIAVSFIISAPTMMTAKAESQETHRYIVLCHNQDVLSLIEIPCKLKDWQFGYNAENGMTGEIWLPTYYFFGSNDPLLSNLCNSATYGDVIEYDGSTMCWTEKSSWNQMQRLKDENGYYASEESFNKIGNVFFDEDYTEYRDFVDGKNVISMTSEEGGKYYALPVNHDVIVPFVHQSELRDTGDVDGSGTVNASDAARVLIASASIGAGNQSALSEAQRWSADVNRDGNINASDAALILMYSADRGAGNNVANLVDYVR